MATEVYRKVGRGGAGNFYAKDNKGKAPIRNDIEAQSPSNPVEPTVSDRPPPDYAYSGRGGAGNWYSPKEVKPTTTAPTLEPLSSRASSLRTAPPSKRAFSGRGGMGNYIEDEEEKRIREEREAEETRKRVQDVVEEVEMTLLSPAKAYLATERAQMDD